MLLFSDCSVETDCARELGLLGICGAGVGIGVAIGVLIVWRRYGRKAVGDLVRPGYERLPSYFKVGEKGGALDGLLGGSWGESQGKVD